MMSMMDAPHAMSQLMGRGLWRMRQLNKTRGKRAAFWRMCLCGQEFYAIGRGRKVARRLAEEHIARCRKRSEEHVNG